MPNEPSNLGPQSPVPGLSGLTVLARGGYSTVYRAHQDSIGREVALKIDTRSLDSERDRRRFIREAQAAGRMSGHPNVVNIYDAGVTADNHPYLVMELCTGGSYATKLRRDGPLPPAEVREIGIRIADALEAAHQAGVLHRDVKPGNILINRYGVPGLADFGLAALPDPDRELSVTVEALTPAYAPPEVFRMEPPTPLGDEYSLAAALYALLSGRPPRWPDSGTPSLATMVHILDEPVPDIPGVPEALSAVLRQAMAADPEDRYPSAAALRDALSALRLDGEADATSGAALPVSGPSGRSGASPNLATGSGGSGSGGSGWGTAGWDVPPAGRSAGAGQPAAPFPVAPFPVAPFPGAPFPAAPQPVAPFPVAPFPVAGTGPTSAPPQHGGQSYHRQPGEVGPPGNVGPVRHLRPPGQPPYGGAYGGPPAPGPPGSGPPGSGPPGSRPPGSGLPGSGSGSPPRKGMSGRGRALLVVGGAVAVVVLIVGIGFALTAFRGDGGSSGAVGASGHTHTPAPLVTVSQPSAASTTDAGLPFDLPSGSYRPCDAIAAAGVDGARCPSAPECWRGEVNDRLRSRSCTSKHIWETYVVGTLDTGTDASNPRAVAADANVRGLCGSSVFQTIQSVITLPAGVWKLAVLTPGTAGEPAGSRAFRCVASLGTDALSRSVFGAS